MEKKFIEILAWVLAGSQRLKIIKSLESSKTPKMIHKNTKINFSNVSNCIIKLKEKKLIYCLNEKAHLGRIYELTDLGKEILKEINKLENIK